MLTTLKMRSLFTCPVLEEWLATSVAITCTKHPNMHFFVNFCLEFLYQTVYNLKWFTINIKNEIHTFAIEHKNKNFKEKSIQTLALVQNSHTCTTLIHKSVAFSLSLSGKIDLVRTFKVHLDVLVKGKDCCHFFKWCSLQCCTSWTASEDLTDDAISWVSSVFPAWKRYITKV